VTNISINNSIEWTNVNYASVVVHSYTVFQTKFCNKKFPKLSGGKIIVFLIL